MRETILRTAFVLLMASSFAAQEIPSDLPSDDAALQQKVKDIGDMSIPDDPVSFQDEVESARQNSDRIKNDIVPSLQGFRVRLQSALNTYQSQLSYLTVRARAQKCVDADAMRQSIRSLNVFFFNTDETALNSEIQRIAGLPDQDLCSAFTKEHEAEKLSTIGSTLVDSAAKRAEAEVPIAEKLQDAWNKRYQKLLINQRQISDTRRSMLWIVLAVCGFSCITLFAVKLFDERLQIELIASGQMIQFPTVMILLIVIVVLGLTTTVKENTLAALLGGIAGYVLSQGVGRQALRQGQMSRPPGNNQNGVVETVPEPKVETAEPQRPATADAHDATVAESS